MNRLHPVEGHESVRASLARAHQRGVLPAALLVHGPRGVGKQRLALWIAQLAVCEAPGATGPCDACRSCRMALGVEHPDIHWYVPLPRPKGVSGDRLGDALESARIDAMAELRANPLRPTLADEMRGLYLGVVQSLRRKAYVAPSMAAFQTFIIAEAELLVPQESSPEAANALLKLLEEPPRSTRFILTTSEPGRLLPTIRSRSVPLHVVPLERSKVAAFLERHRGVDSATASWAAGLGQGSIGRALGYLPTDDDEPGPLDELRRKALALVEAALADGRGAGYGVALGEGPAGARGMVELFAFVEEWLRDLSAVASGATDQIHNRDVADHLATLVQKTDLAPADVASAIVLCEEARELARGNVNPQLIVSGLVRRLRAALRPRRTPTAAVGS